MNYSQKRNISRLTERYYELTIVSLNEDFPALSTDSSNYTIAIYKETTIYNKSK
jgi:hypothetical protein